MTSRRLIQVFQLLAVNHETPSTLIGADEKAGHVVRSNDTNLNLAVGLVAWPQRCQVCAGGGHGFNRSLSFSP